MKKYLLLISLFSLYNLSFAQVGSIVRIAAASAASRALDSGANGYDLRKQTTSYLVINDTKVKCVRTPQIELDKMKSSSEKVATAAMQMIAIEAELEKCKVSLENKQSLKQAPDLENNFSTLQKSIHGFNIKPYRKELAFYKAMAGKPVQ